MSKTVTVSCLTRQGRCHALNCSNCLLLALLAFIWPLGRQLFLTGCLIQLEQNIFLAFGYWVVEASGLVLWHNRVLWGEGGLFNSPSGILESTDLIPESSQNTKMG